MASFFNELRQQQRRQANQVVRAPLTRDIVSLFHFICTALVANSMGFNPEESIYFAILYLTHFNRPGLREIEGHAPESRSLVAQEPFSQAELRNTYFTFFTLSAELRDMHLRLSATSGVLSVPFYYPSFAVLSLTDRLTLEDISPYSSASSYLLLSNHDSDFSTILGTAYYYLTLDGMNITPALQLIPIRPSLFTMPEESANHKKFEDAGFTDEDIPRDKAHLICQLSAQIFTDPVENKKLGLPPVERAWIETHILQKGENPFNRVKLKMDDLKPCDDLRKEAENFVNEMIEKNQSAACPR